MATRSTPPTSGGPNLTRMLDRLLPPSDGETALRHRTGTVVGNNGDGTVDLTLSGTLVPSVPHLAVGLPLVSGDVVQMITHRGGLLVLGKSGQTPAPPEPTPPFAPEVQTFTPTITASALNPSLGNSTVVGRWQELGGQMVHTSMTFVIGSSFTSGAGNYEVSLPVPALNVVNCNQILALHITSQGTEWQGIATIEPSQQVLRTQRGYADASGTRRVLHATSAGGWSTGDRFTISGSYLRGS